jgi:type IV pilus assembly protein PilV
MGNSMGFSLLEVMITLLILSVGLLGLAGLQAQSLRFNHFAFMRGQSSMLAYAMADRMRANRFAVVTNAGNYVGAYNETDGGNYQAPNNNGCTQATPGGTATNCTINQMAAHDRFQWDADLALYLASGQGRVCVDATPLTVGCDNQCIDPADVSIPPTPVACATNFIIPIIITVMWDETRTNVTGTGCDLDNAADLKCFSVGFEVSP